MFPCNLHPRADIKLQEDPKFDTELPKQKKKKAIGSLTTASGRSGRRRLECRCLVSELRRWRLVVAVEVARGGVRGGAGLGARAAALGRG
jgi:hypothetical protein